MMGNESRIMTADELLGFSEEKCEPITVELTEGMSVKIRPLGLTETLKIQSGIDTDTPEGMAQYLAETISMSIVEPELNAEQRQTLKADIISWPSNTVNKVMSSYYEGMGITPDELDSSIESAAAFLEENKEE